MIYTDSTSTFRSCVIVILYEIFCSPFGWKKNCMVLPPLFFFTFLIQYNKCTYTYHWTGQIIFSFLIHCRICLAILL